MTTAAQRARRGAVATRTVVDARARRRARIAAALRRPPAAYRRWWAGLEPEERIFYRAATALGLGLGVGVWPPFVLIVPGVLWTLVFFGFDLRRGA